MKATGEYVTKPHMYFVNFVALYRMCDLSNEVFYNSYEQRSKGNIALYWLFILY